MDCLQDFLHTIYWRESREYVPTLKLLSTLHAVLLEGEEIYVAHPTTSPLTKHHL